MGGGASTATGGKAGKGATKKAISGSEFLQKAKESEDAAKQLFGLIDADKNKKLSNEEIKAALKKYGKDLSATWTDALITEVILFFDRDGDGMLDLAEFTDVMRDLKMRGGLDVASLKARKAAAEEAARLTKELKAVYDKYLKKEGEAGGIWDKSSTAKLIRELNDANGYWDDFGSKVTEAHAQLTGDDGRKAVASLSQFVEWYPSLLAETAAIQRKWDELDAAKAAAVSAAKAEEFTAGKEEWEVHMKRLPDAIHAALKLEKTPLLIDMTTPKGESKSAGFSPLENYYTYSGHALIELKKAVVEVTVKKEKSIDDVQKEFAKKLLSGLKTGKELTLLLSNSAPPLKTKLMTSSLFPYQLLDAAVVKGALAEGVQLDETFVKPLLDWMLETKLNEDPLYNLTVPHPDFHLCLVTKFDPADYKGYLEDELPFEKLQPIKVFTD